MTIEEHKMLMVKFSDWIKSQDLNIVQDSNGAVWSSSYQGGENYTGSELLEYFYHNLDI